MTTSAEKPTSEISTQELVEQLFALHDAELHALFERLLIEE